jgi:transcriptional regulator with XRE-family HTH domain
MIDDRRLYQAVGEKVRNLREAQQGVKGHMTQGELAALVGLERTSITNIERGNQKVPLHVLFRIAEVLKAPITEVLPSVGQVSLNKEEQIYEDVEFGDSTVKATPLVKQAVEALLNLGKSQ